MLLGYSVVWTIKSCRNAQRQDATSLWLKYLIDDQQRKLRAEPFSEQDYTKSEACSVVVKVVDEL